MVNGQVRQKLGGMCMSVLSHHAGRHIPSSGNGTGLRGFWKNGKWTGKAETRWNVYVSA